MLYPSIDEMMKKVDSKYSLVIASSRRARQLREGGKTNVKSPKSHKNVGIALEEIYADMIVVEPGTEEENNK
ncbi:DNA-directed RNA polymerase subunit omega [Paenibacillus sp. IHBB 10380]|uniref:DNA-directed RNA polymerase subunit omega n=1 Tax=Paenibacillus sp. IHBB 10380 TaxID=1566358 RepID=UPI0005CF955E|nr:DNA-directed RNA polymerase subunit omega [Paenibacillus sp. IHBB 10380]AJS57858.1 DNA-directed RNA polymerase subunit omega [Paenibacillus sp. IHBB 10380]